MGGTTIGIGAGRYVDEQVPVITDVVCLGGEGEGDCLSKRYADLDTVIRDAVEAYVDDVESGQFPARENTYEPIDEE